MPSRNTLPTRPTGNLRRDIEAIWEAVRALQILDSPDIVASPGPSGTALRLRQHQSSTTAAQGEDPGVWI